LISGSLEDAEDSLAVLTARDEPAEPAEPADKVYAELGLTAA
jgi:hypothetical protein